MEIIGSDFKCNLSEIHLNMLDPFNLDEQEQAFKAASISVCTLLHDKFPDQRYQYSRDIDPIVGVSFTGLFDFFVKLFGVDWLKWWEAGRPSVYEGNQLSVSPLLADLAVSLGVNLAIDVIKRGVGFDATFNIAQMFTWIEQAYLNYWKGIVQDEVEAYCTKHGLRVPNRCTTVQPAGSKSLLTGASSGWQQPKAARYIRRITFDRDNPIALACRDYGYSIIPGQSDKDENGNLLNDPFDPRCTEWLVEMPCQTVWADLPGCDQIDISKFSVAAQFDFCMQVQRFYTTHNTSATLELRENEINILSDLIYNSIQNDEGYISAALLARFDSLETFPRLPFEPIDQETYNKLHEGVLSRRKADDFISLLAQYDKKAVDAFNQGAAGCDSDKCLMPEKKPNTSPSLALGQALADGLIEGLELTTDLKETK